MAEFPPPDPGDHGAIVLIERIMTQHWDLAACHCWICDEGRLLGCRPRQLYLSYTSDPSVNHHRRARTTVDWGNVKWVPKFLTAEEMAK